jgi:hypothetical protein
MDKPPFATVPQLSPAVTDTQYKLLEAHFFLGHLKRSVGKFDTFNYYLSAFISAARSVSDVMKREYTRKAPGFEEWMKKVECDRTKEEQELFDLTIDMRDTNVHEGRLKARATYKVKLSKTDRERFAKSPLVGNLMVVFKGPMRACRMGIVNPKTGECDTVSVVKVMQTRRYVDDRPNEDVLATCQRAFELLVPFVYECTKRFGVVSQPSSTTRTNKRWKRPPRTAGSTNVTSEI